MQENSVCIFSKLLIGHEEENEAINRIAPKLYENPRFIKPHKTTKNGKPNVKIKTR